MIRYNRFGLIGSPITHSLSPELFKAAYSGKYIYDLIVEDDFDKAFATFMSSYDAVNVTQPFKDKALQKADGCADYVRRIGAANILLKDGDEIIAHNSDYTGVKMILQDHFEIESEQTSEKIKALVIGCGGAARAAACAAADLGIKTTIVNRTPEKVNEFISRPGNGGIIAGDFTKLGKHISDSQLIIYAIPQALEEIMHMAKRAFRSKSILEANYAKPSFSRQHHGITLNRRVSEKFIEIPQRCYYLSGEIWLFAQALTGYSLLTGENPDERAMMDVLYSYKQQ